MSLATRCPACNTVFRVLQDQLRVSEGWVRCGQCQEVFNALETLFDLSAPAEAGAPANPPPAVFTPPPPAPPPFTPPPTAIAPPPPVPAPPAPRPAPAFAASSPAASTTMTAALHAPEPETEPPPDFAPTTPAHAGDPFDDIDTFTVIDGDNLGVEAEGPLPEDDWHSLPPPLPPADEEEARDMRFDAPPSPARTASPTPAERASSFAAPVTPARPAPTDPVDAFFADEVDTVTAAAFEAAAEDPVDDDEDEQAPTPSRFVGPMPDWARTPSTQRKSKKGKSRLPPDSALAQEHQARHARRKRRKPEFVRQAERAALWRRPMVRVVLGMAALALGALLAGQVGYHYREPLSAQAPSLTPVLKAGCEWLQCKIGAPRVIERIRLDASDLTRTDQEQVLRFTADLHNTAEFAVRTPALDVSFTDALGRIVSRKVLLPKELGARGESIAPDTQWRIDARLSVGELQVAGYTVEVFYP